MNSSFESGESNVIQYPGQNSDYGVLIPAGEYQLKLVDHYTAIKFSSPRLILVFQVIDFGEHHGCQLERFFYVRDLKGKPRRKGACWHKARGDFMIEYCTVLPDARKPRLDRVPIEPLYNHVIIGRVATVKHNNQQKKLPEQLWYSKVAELLRVEQ